MNTIYAASLKATPQTSPLIGTDQVKNNAGGYVYRTSSKTFLKRFLLLGTEGGTYYTQAKPLTVNSANKIIALIKYEGKVIVEETVNVSTKGLAPKNTPAIFVLALATKFGDKDTRKLAYDSIYKVCRTGTHLFEFLEFCKLLDKKWSHGLRRGVANYYMQDAPNELSFKLLKYKHRKNWTHKDVIRLCHPSSRDARIGLLFRYIVDKHPGGEDFNFIPIVAAYETIRNLPETKAEEAIELITKYNLPWEFLPAHFHKYPEVWNALALNMGTIALIRNLGRMTSIGCFNKALGDMEDFVVKKLTNPKTWEGLTMHPVNVLIALRTYQKGSGEKGSMVWNPVTTIARALEEAFYLSFKQLKPTNKKILLALDVSGSMGDEISGLPISCREASAALAMAFIRTEPNITVMAFSKGFIPLNINKEDSLETVIGKIKGLPFDATDCSIPMLYAMQKKLDVDCFQIWTDNETYCGKIHPKQALQAYREHFNPEAKLAVVAMTATDFSIADPNDPNSLDVVGFDASLPSVLEQFIGVEEQTIDLL